MTGTTGDEIRRMFREHEITMARLVHQVVGPIKEDLSEIKAEVKKTNGRVTQLEGARIARDARELALAEAAKSAADTIAAKTAAAIEARERSTRWWVGVIGAAAAVTGIAATTSSALAQLIT